MTGSITQLVWHSEMLSLKKYARQVAACRSSYAALLSYYREQYARTSSLDAREIAAEARDALDVLARTVLANMPEGEGSRIFDALTVEQRAEVMRALANKGIAPAGPVADGSFLLSAPRAILGHLIGEFPELVFDGRYWDAPYSTLDYGDTQLTDRARQQIIDRAKSLIADAAWLAEADMTSLRRERKAGLAKLKKDAMLARHGYLFCERCGIVPIKELGAHGDAVIEVHHTIPVATMSDGHETKLDDLECLCANCHRIRHREIAQE